MPDGRRTIKKPSYLQRTGYHAMLVGGVALLASILLVMGNLLTKEAIAQRHAEDVQAMLNEVIPAKLHDNNLLEDKLDIENVEVFQARIEGHVSAVAFQVSEPGYSGEISLIMAVNNKGTLIGVRVVSHTETPGLGDKMETARSPWILSFDGKTLTNQNSIQWAVKKDGGEFDQFTGATITPRAIVKAVKQGMQFFQEHKQTLLSYQTKNNEQATEEPEQASENKQSSDTDNKVEKNE